MEELELEKQEKSVVDSVGWDVCLLNELECFVNSEHLLHLLGESRYDRVAIAIHRESFLMENSVVWLSERKRWDSLVPDCSAAVRVNRAGVLRVRGGRVMT